MFEFLKNIFNKKKKATTEETKPLIEESQKNILNITREKNSIQIEILENCTLEKFSSSCQSCDLDKLKIPVRMYIKDNNDNLKLCAQKLYIFKLDNKTYHFANNSRQLKMSQQKIIENKIEEIEVDIVKPSRTYKITKYIHDLNRSTISTKWYPQNNPNMEMFSLQRKSAFVSVYKLLEEMEKDNICSFGNLDKIYNYLGLVFKDNYFPVISNGEITLSWPYRFNETDINKRDYEHLDIILNETKQIIGEIDFDYRTSEGFTYGGNVSYRIKEEFRGNHYATSALGLLKKLLKANLFEGDKDLYISTTPENYLSQKVVLNNNGELFYKGKVPEDDSLNFIDGVKKVNVYRIKM